MPPPIPKLKFPPAGMSKKTIPGIDILQVMWSSEHVVPINSKIQLTNPRHPRHEVMKRKWESRTDPLWWNCLSSKQISMKSVVRSWVNIRARLAIVNALKRKGYDTNGYRIDGNGDEAPKPNLVGSLHLSTRPELLRAKWPDVEDQADKIIAEVERLQTDKAKPKRKKRTME
ncbi:hypothetical protein VC83_02281 [Pseudogymnoascus destructans]|nr:uncharacterized protein VC83_02281 [Pseudogymnoascus destructans]OAF60832.1 hypothetical protein VC83_02281 [Pseudogymnoascus destructans]